MSVRVAILTISDSCHNGARQDLSGPALAARVTALGWTPAAAEVLPDERDLIAERLAALADSGLELILATGGTGVAPRDVTPEAVRLVIDKEIPGLGEAMRAKGLEKTPMSVLSRSIGGARGRTLIVGVPGSPKGAVESLDAIANVIPHIVDLLAGRTGH